jgi:hypothetical protein
MAGKIGEMVDMETGESSAIYEELLDNPEADAALSKIAVERAIAENGMSRADAERYYG